MGIDLATEKGKTGICILNKKTQTFIVYSDGEILSIVKNGKPKAIAIDAPCSFPGKGYYRGCDLQVRKAGIPIFSFNLPALRKLAARGINLTKKLKKISKAKIIETYPYAVLRMNSRTAKNVARKKFPNKHEKDAYICALVAKKFASGKAKFFSGGGKIWY